MRLIHKTFLPHHEWRAQGLSGILSLRICKTQRCKHTKAVMVSTCMTGRKRRKHLASAFFFYWERGGLWFKTCRNKNSKWWQFLWISSHHVSQLLVEYFKTDSWRALLLFLNVSSVFYILNSVKLIHNSWRSSRISTSYNASEALYSLTLYAAQLYQRYLAPADLCLWL